MESLDAPTFRGNVDEVIRIPDSLLGEYEKRRYNALVGSYDHIKREFHKMPITEGWGAYSFALKKSGAIVAVKYKIPMVNTDIIPAGLSPYILENEVVESTLDSDPSENHTEIAFAAISILNLNRFVKVSRPRWNHAFAVVHQLRMAQKDSKLEEMMNFADGLESRGENIVDAFGNRDFRYAVVDLLSAQV